MYAFVFGLNGKVIFGREWSDLIRIMEALQKAYDLSERKRLCVYVHNLSWEFQWMCDRFQWLDVFATDDRKPVKALTSYGIEFRDSLILSGLSLALTAENLTKYKIEKLKGDLDYSLARHYRTKLTPVEWHYIENDGLCVMAFIQEEIERNNGNICNIPMTKTGYVRKYMKNQCYHDGFAGHGERRKIKTRSFMSYRKLMRILQITKEEYILAKEEFQGGFTHANCFNVGLIFNDVASYDLTSAYPSVMALERYPMGTGSRLECPTSEIVERTLKLYACLFRARIWGISSRYRGDNFLSQSKCRCLKGEEVDNGRIISADYLETTLTDIDLEILRAFYEIGRIEYFDFWYYPRGYLPTAYIKGVLGLYADKTTLKGVEGQEANYSLKKGMLNSVYGMSVTSIDQINHRFKNGEWSVEPPDLDALLEKYNESFNRFGSYLWGIFVTCHVRKIIARAILELGDDYIYADTDSVKFKNADAHRAFFEDYNRLIDRKIERSSKINGLPIDLFKPKTIDGKEKPIGYFDFEGVYRRFKTLGAKRYFVEYPEPHNIGGIVCPYSLTISGVNKTIAIPSLVRKSEQEHKDIFDYFEIGVTYDESTCGKNTRTYCDSEIKGILTDYQGKRGKYHEYRYIHLEPTTYKMTTTEEYYQMIYLDAYQRIERRETLKR